MPYDYEMADPADEEKPLPSWFPQGAGIVRAKPAEALDPREIRRARLAAACVLLLGIGGVAIGSLVPGAGMELLVGALLVVLAARALFYIGRD